MSMILCKQYFYCLLFYWDGWMASPTGWIWVWASSRSWWWTGKPGELQSMGSQRVRHDWATELNWNNTYSQGGSCIHKGCHPSFFSPCLHLLSKHLFRRSYWLSGKESACQCRRHRLIPGWERSPGEGNGKLFQYSCLGNPMDTGAWRATIHRVAKSQTDWVTKQQMKINLINQNYGMCAKLLQLYLTLWDPMDCSLPGSPVHGILQARILEWAAISSSRGSSYPGIEPTFLMSPPWQAGSLPLAPPRKFPKVWQSLNF